MSSVLSIDPGKVNMGFAIVKKKKNKKKKIVYQVAQFGMLSHPLADLKAHNLKPVILQFNAEIDQLLTTHQVQAVSMERFISRGLLGSLAEYICIMQGVISVNPKVKAFNLVTPPAWKNSFNRQADLKAFYKLGLKYKIKPHEIDAVLIGFYYLGAGLAFKKFSRPSYQHKFLASLAAKRDCQLSLI